MLISPSCVQETGSGTPPRTLRGLACGFGVIRCDALCSTGFVDRRHIGGCHDVNPGEPGAEALGQCDGQG
jgi:hypothetical protein